MKKTNRIISGALALLMAVSLSNSAFAKDTQAIKSQLVAIQTDDGSVTTTWDSHFFINESSQFNSELAKIALLLSDTAYQKNQIQKTQKQLGFDCQTYGYDVKSQLLDNKTAYTIGHQKMVIDQQEFYVINVVVRGTVDLEWASNFRVTNTSNELANGSDHYGFSQAANQILNSCKAYQKAHKELQGSENRVLISGHSRGAGVANLLAKEMSDKQILASQDHIYAYTFATPNVTINPKNVSYKHIFNLINAEDVVTQIPLEQWGFKRYGQDVMIPTPNDKNYNQMFTQMKKNYKELTSKEYNGNVKTYNKTMQLIELTNKAVPTMQDYTSKVFINGQSLQNFGENIYALVMARQNLDLDFSSFTTLSKYASLLKQPLFVSWSQYLLGENILTGQLDTTNTFSHQANVYYSWLLAMNSTK